MTPFKVSFNKRHIIPAPRELQKAWDAAYTSLTAVLSAHGFDWDKPEIEAWLYLWQPANDWLEKAIAETPGEHYSSRFDLTRSGKLRLTLIQRHTVDALIPDDIPVSVTSDIGQRAPLMSRH